MAAAKNTITLNGEEVTVKPLADCEVKIGVMRKIDVDSLEGAIELFKIVTGKDDEFVNEITNVELNEALKLAQI